MGGDVLEEFLLPRLGRDLQELGDEEDGVFSNCLQRALEGANAVQSSFGASLARVMRTYWMSSHHSYGVIHLLWLVLSAVLWALWAARR